MTRLSYALVTPARNEAANLGRLADCIAEQALPPDAWVVVDDGSTDATAEVAAAFARGHPWMRVIPSPGATTSDGPLTGGRRSGRDVIAFEAGVASLGEDLDIVVKLDADVSFGRDFLDTLVREFERDPRLGICGGMCYEETRGQWRPYRVTRGHVRGATRAYRWSCLRQVSPLDEQLGWDAVDEIRARLQGWTTRSIDAPFYHHRGLGERDGARRQWESQGTLAYYLGYRYSYLVARAAWRGWREPTAFRMLTAYAGAARRRAPRCPDERVRAHLRHEQSLRRLPVRFREVLGRT